MVGKTGFEPATPWSQTKCSTKLSHFPLYGAPDRSRTHNLLIRSQTIYPIDLRAHYLSYVNNLMVAPAGIEPATQGFSVPCSTDWAMEPKKMAVPTRIELAIFCVTGKRDNRYTTGPNGCGDKIWTCGLRVMSPTSYQAAPLRDIVK